MRISKSIMRRDGAGGSCWKMDRGASRMAAGEICGSYDARSTTIM
jgi:hypothetical protein